MTSRGKVLPLRVNILDHPFPRKNMPSGFAEDKHNLDKSICKTLGDP